MKLTFKLTRKDLLEYLYGISKNSTASNFIQGMFVIGTICLVVSLPIFIFYVYLLIISKNLSYYLSFVIYMLFLYIFCCFVLIFRYKIAIFFLSKILNINEKVHCIKIDEREVTVLNSKKSETYHPGDFVRIYNLAESIVACSSSRMVFLLPKRAFKDKDEISVFLSLLEKFKKK